ncbi:TIGR02206 family membrane protein [Brachybacterium muris]|nr:TIGR02206 family membrane protein [Brachybacterium muris]MCT1654648.1 TIGR02206 family membrane protein [Brachybacterium muris]MCT2296166.1 TIGR02206 family membrane protein [Brachybacterium muris]
MTPPPLGRMTTYGLEHIGVLALIVACSVALVLWSRRTERARVDRALRVAGWVLLVDAVLWMLWGFMPWAWNLHESLPLHFSDALRILLPLALILRRPWMIVVACYWGLTLNLQSVLTPDVNYFVCVPLEFFQYWLAHGSGVVLPAVLIWGLGLHPTWRGFAVAYAATVGWAMLAFTANLLLGTNYAYLNRPPAGPSILDLMGPWPQYLLVEAVAIAVGWALLTLPFALVDRRLGTPVAGPGGLLRITGPSRPNDKSRRTGPSRQTGPSAEAGSSPQSSSSTWARRSGP